MSSVNHTDDISGCCMNIQFAIESSNNDVIKPSADENVNSLAGLPSVLVPYDSKAVFYQYFSRCPVTLQLTNIKIKSMSDSADHSVDRSFVHKSDLRQWLTQHAEQHPSVKLHVSGNVCGRLAEVVNNTRMTDLSLSFDCVLSMSHCADEDSDMVDDNTSSHPVLMRVDDVSISMRALLKLTDAAVGISMVADDITVEVAKFTIDKSLSETEIDQLDNQTMDVKEFAKYHSIKLSDSSIKTPCNIGDFGLVTADSFYPHPCFIDRRLVVTAVEDNLCEMRFDQSQVVTELDVLVYNRDQVRLSDSVVFGDCEWPLVIKAKDGKYVQHDSTPQCSISVTWQKDEAPPAVWALKADAEPYTPDPDVLLADPDTTRVDRWHLDDQSIIFRQRYLDDHVTTEEVTVTFDIPSEKCAYNASCIIETMASVAPYVYDRLLACEKQNLAKAKSAGASPSASPLSPLVEPLMSFITRVFPILKMDDTCVPNIGMTLQHSTYDNTWSIQDESSLVELPAFCGDIDVSFECTRDYLRGSNNRVMRVSFDEDTEMNIEQMLNACGQSSVVAHMPRELLSVPLHTCSIRVKDGELSAYGKIGSKKLDRFLLLHCVDKDARYASAYSTFIKIHHKQLIKPQTFRALQRFGTGDAQHCYVYLDAKQPLPVDWNLNYHIKKSEPGLEYLERDPLPESAIIPLGSHFFTIKQRKSTYWTSALDGDANMLAQDESQDTCATKRPRLNDTMNGGNKFNIPLALLTNPRSSAELAQHVLEFVGMSDVLFGINMLEHAQHGHVVLLDDKWWKRRLTHELGSHVTRWSDDVLRSWRQQWLEGKPWLDEYQRRKLKPATKVVRQRVMSQPLWFNAAVHLATRLGKFAREMLYQANHDVRMPAAMRYVLTVAPPFQLCSQYLMERYVLWSRLHQATFDDSFIVNDKSYRWFAETEDRAEGTLFMALYTGISYVISDDNTASLGKPVDVDGSADRIPWRDYQDEVGCSIREVVLTDPDFWPVVEWEAYQLGIRIVASNLHEYFIKRDTYRYCDELHAMWDERAASNTPQSLCDPHLLFAPSYRIRFSDRYMSSILQQLVDESTDLNL